MRRELATVGWGFFCASSWTWCIGMYLPVLLLRHFGWPGVVAFAVPNVAGCVAFGYVLGDRSARRLTEKHAWACGLFSLVTVAYHLFFAAFVGASLIPGFSSPLLIAVSAAVALFVAGLGLSRIPDRAWPAVAMLVYCISLLAFVRLGAGPLSQIPWQGDLGGWRLAFLAPSLAFGFLLCPYLDLTFHRALLESPSRHAFAVFGAAFSVMILLTCVYWDAARTGLATAALVHLSVQAIFTVAAHLRELRGWVASTALDVRWLVWTAPFAAVPLALVPLAWEDPLQSGEGMYLRFLVFYGLVFPLYVLLFLGRRPVCEVSRRSLLIFAGLVLLASPCYELGFLHEKTWFLLISLGAILAVVAYWRLARRRDHEDSAAGPPRAPAASATQSQRRTTVTGTSSGRF